MPAPQAPVRSHHDEVTEAKREMRRAYDALHAAGGVSALRADSLLADTLTAVVGQTRPTQAEMYRRTEHLMVLIEDRGRWGR